MRQILVSMFLGGLFFLVHVAAFAEETNDSLQFYGIGPLPDGKYQIVYKDADKVREVVLQKELAEIAAQIEWLVGMAIFVERDDVDLQFSEKQRKLIQNARQSAVHKFVILVDRNEQDELMPNDLKAGITPITREISECKEALLDFQHKRYEQFTIWSQIVNAGLIETLTNSGYTTELRITKRQEQSMQSLKGELEREFSEEVNELMIKYKKEMIDGFDPVVRKKLTKIIGDDESWMNLDSSYLEVLKRMLHL